MFVSIFGAPATPMFRVRRLLWYARTGGMGWMGWEDHHHHHNYPWSMMIVGLLLLYDDDGWMDGCLLARSLSPLINCFYVHTTRYHPK